MFNELSGIPPQAFPIFNQLEPDESFMDNRFSGSLVITVEEGDMHLANAQIAVGENQVYMIGGDSLCDLRSTGSGVSDKHCIISCWAGVVWVKTLAEAYLEDALLPLDKSCIWGIGQKLTIGNIRLVLQAKLSSWGKLQRTTGKILSSPGFNSNILIKRIFPATTAALLVIGLQYAMPDLFGLHQDSAESSALVQQPATTPATGQDMNKIATDVAEVFRLSGLVVTTLPDKAGEVRVRGSFSRTEDLGRIIYSPAMRAIPGLQKILVETRNNDETSPGSEKIEHFIDYVVDGKDQYLIATDGSRYYVGSRLPGGEKLTAITEDQIQLQSNGEVLQIPKMMFAVSQGLLRPAQPEPSNFTAYAVEDFDHDIAEAAQRFDLPEAVIRAVIHAESGYNPLAVSHAGAMGLMQLMSDTADHLEVDDPFDPRQNILGGARHLKSLLNRYHNNLPLALAAYNAGEGSVQRYGGIPPYPETRDYVAKVQRLVDYYDKE